MARTVYAIVTTNTDISVSTLPYLNKKSASDAAKELAAEHPGVTFQVVTRKGKVVDEVTVATPAADVPADQVPADLHVPAEGEEVRFLVAKRLADYIVKNGADYRPDVVAALQDGIVHRATGKGNQVLVKTSAATAKAVRVVFKELHLALQTDVLTKVPFRTTTT